MKPKLYQVNWSYINGKGTNESIKDYCIGSILNVCCGKSFLGDVRIDLDPQTTFNIKGDCFNLPIRPRSFDTVLLDPPYSYFNKFKWIQKIGDTARKRIIICAGQVAIRLTKFRLMQIIAVVTNTFFVRLWYIYDRVQEDLIL